MLGITVLAPRTGGIAMISIIRGAVSAGTARHGTAVLAVRILAPGTIAHAVAVVVIGRISAIPAIAFAPVLRCGILFP